MGKKAKPIDAVRQEVAERFAFLVTEAGFAGPEYLDDERFHFHQGDIVYRRDGMHIETSLWSGHEPELCTSISGGEHLPSMELGQLYAAIGCGPAQDVPGNTGNLRLTLKRVGQHAQALRRVLPHLLDQDVDALIRHHRNLPPPPDAGL